MYQTLLEEAGARLESECSDANATNLRLSHGGSQMRLLQMHHASELETLKTEMARQREEHHSIALRLRRACELQDQLRSEVAVRANELAEEREAGAEEVERLTALK